MNLKEKQINSELIYDGIIVKLCLDEVKLPDGRPAKREYVRHPGGVCVVPVTDEGEIMLVRQYRYVYGQEILEIPAGKRDSADEPPLEGGKRELKEELGITADRFVDLGTFYPTPGYTDEVIYMYAAFGLHFGESEPDDDEFVEPEKIKLETLVDMIFSGEIKDGKTQAAVLKVYNMLKKKSESLKCDYCANF